MDVDKIMFHSSSRLSACLCISQVLLGGQELMAELEPLVGLDQQAETAFQGAQGPLVIQAGMVQVDPQAELGQLVQSDLFQKQF